MLHHAIEFSTLAHKGQVRKATGIPNIVHPCEVAVILAQAGACTEVICAGMLHDTVEDTDITIDEIRKEFGNRVADLVWERTEDKTLSWEARKQNTINSVKSMDPKDSLDSMLIVCADKLANVRSMKADYERIGEELWHRFRRGKEYQKWYYKEIVLALSSLSSYSMYQELKQLVLELFC